MSVANMIFLVKPHLTTNPIAGHSKFSISWSGWVEKVGFCSRMCKLEDGSPLDLSTISRYSRNALAFLEYHLAMPGKVVI
jgi:hypothetical protein